MKELNISDPGSCPNRVGYADKLVLPSSRIEATLFNLPHRIERDLDKISSPPPCLQEYSSARLINQLMC